MPSFNVRMVEIPGLCGVSTVQRTPTLEALRADELAPCELCPS